MCLFFHRFRIVSCEPKKKLFVTETKLSRKFYFAYNTIWKCLDCNKEIKKNIRQGHEGWKTLERFLQEQDKLSHFSDEALCLKELDKISSSKPCFRPPPLR